MIPQYTILTPMDCYTFNEGDPTEQELDRRVEEQNDILTANGYKFGKAYKLHFFASPYTNEGTADLNIDEGIQALAIKDGVDIVRYGNGNIGFIAYYNGNVNGFEIIGDTEEAEE